MFCPNCGAENQDGAKFCRECGATLDAQPQQAAQQAAASEPQPDMQQTQVQPTPQDTSARPWEVPQQTQQTQQYEVPQGAQQTQQYDQQYVPQGGQQAAAPAKKSGRGKIIAIVAVVVVAIVAAVIALGGGSDSGSNSGSGSASIGGGTSSGSGTTAVTEGMLATELSTRTDNWYFEGTDSGSGLEVILQASADFSYTGIIFADEDEGNYVAFYGDSTLEDNGDGTYTVTISDEEDERDYDFLITDGEETISLTYRYTDTSVGSYDSGSGTKSTVELTPGEYEPSTSEGVVSDGLASDASFSFSGTDSDNGMTITLEATAGFETVDLRFIMSDGNSYISFIGPGDLTDNGDGSFELVVSDEESEADYTFTFVQGTDSIDLDYRVGDSGGIGGPYYSGGTAYTTTLYVS